MSINLVFLMKDVGVVPFPIQTSTDLTYKVLMEESNEGRLRIINEELKKWEWTKKGRVETLKRIKTLMDNPNLTLEMW